MATAVDELPEQRAADLVPHDAGETAAAPGDAAAGTASARASGGLVVHQDKLQRGDDPGVLTGPFQLGQRVPHRADDLRSWGWPANQVTVRADSSNVTPTRAIGVVEAAGLVPRGVVGTSARPMPGGRGPGQSAQ